MGNVRINYYSVVKSNIFDNYVIFQGVIWNQAFCFPLYELICYKVYLGVKNIKKKPYNILLLIALTLVLASFIFNQGNTTVDIHLHDTYFIIANVQIFWLLAFISLLVWTFYLLTYKKLYSATLAWIHIITTGLTIILLGSILFLSNIKQQITMYQNNRTMAITTTIMVLLLVQIIFIVNFLLGLFARRT